MRPREAYLHGDLLVAHSRSFEATSSEPSGSVTQPHAGGQRRIVHTAIVKVTQFTQVFLKAIWLKFKLVLDHVAEEGF